jgi:glycerophosphoryl diester phosphodiesterase
VEIIAHRGASHAAPENTLAAAALAWAEHADALEFDVRLTADAQLAVIHDENTKRVAREKLTISQVTMAELKLLDVGHWKEARYAGEKIPTLDEMLGAVPEKKCVFIELKGGPEIIAPLGICLSRCRLQSQQIVIISFDFATVAAAKKTLPHHAAAWILDRDDYARHRSIDAIIGQCRDSGLDGLDLAASCPIDAMLLKQVHRAGLKLYVWTVDDPAVARRLAEAGVDGITTNRPGWLREKLAG